MLEEHQGVKRELRFAFFCFLWENKNLGYWDSESQTKIWEKYWVLGEQLTEKWPNLGWEVGFIPPPPPSGLSYYLENTIASLYLI